jgi:solute carrier family 13 (sodium-dependent dicarboxylate transporter), member 2/3/5
VSAPAAGESPTRAAMRRWGVVLGPLTAAVVYLLVPDSATDVAGEVLELGHAGRATAAIGVWMAIWWMTEAVHVSATALLPVTLFPLLSVRSVDDAASPYANPLIFLFLGGFLLALGCSAGASSAGSPWWRCASWAPSPAGWWAPSW